MPASNPSTSPDATPLSLRFIDSTHTEPKKKKAHRKSRGGCTPCKRRKVKCDEATPCANCIRRNEPCTRLQQSSTPETTSPAAASTGPARPLDPSGPVNLLHMQLLHHFQHATIPTLCFADVWASVLPLAFRAEYLMTAILAVSARHLSTLRPEDAVYEEASLALLSRSCALFGAELGRDDEAGGEGYDSLFFTAQLIHYLTWCNLDFIDGSDDTGATLDLSQDQLFLLSSGLRVFLSGTRAQGKDSIFTKAWQDAPCDALDKIVTEQDMDRSRIQTALMDRYDEMTAESQTPPPNPSSTGSQGTVAPEHHHHHHNSNADRQRAVSAGIVERLSVILALWHHRATNPQPPARPDLERYILAFPLFCFGPLLDMIVANDPRALLVLYHFYETSRLLLGEEEEEEGEGKATWWACDRLNAMPKRIEREMRRRGIQPLVM
ncbi:hypothetical protein BDP81DRAFT_463380 [Colletotrichum phormii]|uniref:Zn(2)-C6 fungal-type domain-containing protein n=1 Tax=Colletotrichum phormii TaxID=359342 RepID=A0AAI9ZKL1_9PEZI|nr:uncharacterized protein BDP81DRAFT_463380 [Colletotrichum phormii]KAK1633702.1 hypothetical protein BDP81DRAFT_463380 [Colletotrichum phormii]